MPSASDGEAELVAGAEHALALHAHLLGALDAPVAGQHRARQRDGHPLTRPRCWSRRTRSQQRLARRPPDAWSARAGRSADAGRPSGARRRRPCSSRRPPLDALDLHPQQGQALRERLRRQGRRRRTRSSQEYNGTLSDDRVRSPRSEATLQRAIGPRSSSSERPRKRRSFPRYSRRSGTAWRRSRSGRRPSRTRSPGSAPGRCRRCGARRGGPCPRPGWSSSRSAPQAGQPGAVTHDAQDVERDRWAP